MADSKCYEKNCYCHLDSIVLLLLLRYNNNAAKQNTMGIEGVVDRTQDFFFFLKEASPVQNFW